MERPGLKIHYFDPRLNLHYARPKELCGEVGTSFVLNSFNENVDCVFNYYQETLL